MTVLDGAWSALGERPELLDRVLPPERPVPLPSPLRVGGLVADGVALASLAANLLLAARRRGGGGDPAPDDVATVQVDPLRVATACGSERHFRLDGTPPDVWAPLSGFFPAADGWVRTHANYPHHAERLRTVLGLPASADAAAVPIALAGVEAAELEERAAAAGAVVAAVRAPDVWRTHPQARAAEGTAPVEVSRTGGAPARAWPAPAAPLAGVRVVDLTRVIAGPVATRTLALAGADVLRLDPPHPAEIGWQHLDTGQGKRSALLDLAGTDGREALDALLREADVLVTGYRPGTLDRFGLSPEALAVTHPGLVTARVSAWHPAGPWGGRRGFDSIVQATTGIAHLHGSDGRPGALPAQALDHTAGYLLAAGVMSALRRQRLEGGSHHVAVTLQRVGALLLDAGPGDPVGPPDGATVDEGDTGAGRVTCAAPALAFEDAPAGWPRMAHPWGADPPSW